MPRTTTNPAKLDAVVAYFQRTGVAHALKDLEKSIPSATGVAGMQVKDYLQALADDGRICVEKIGSGNWYWSFAGAERRAREAELLKSRARRDALAGEAGEADARLKAERARRAREGEDSAEAEARRDELLAQRAALYARRAALAADLAALKELDPAHLAAVKDQKGAALNLANKWTDEICNMESFLKRQGCDGAALGALRREVYEDEYDSDSGGLREL